MNDLDFYKDKFVPSNKPARRVPVMAPIVVVEEETEFVCPKCGRRDVEKHPTERYCEDCVKAEKARYMRVYTANAGWQDVAQENGLNLWDRQPGESNWEYAVWTTYMGMYPFAKPDYRAVAEKLDTTYGCVKHIAQRWDFRVRLQAYIVYCDSMMKAQRTEAMLEMNAEYIDAASQLRGKIAAAVQMVDPAALAMSPKDLVAVAKLADELERRARLDESTRIDELATIHGGGNAESKKHITKQDDIAEIAKVFAEAGLIPQAVGVRQTTELVVQTAGAEVPIMMEVSDDDGHE